MSPLVRKLRHGSILTGSDQALLDRLAGPAWRADRGDLVPEGARARSVLLVLEGWVCRSKLLENGRRQITSVFLPGDLCGPFGALPDVTDDVLSALTPTLLAHVSPHALREAARASPGIGDALWWNLLLSDALQREHLVSLGRRTAAERLGHLFCELHLRLGMVGLADEASYTFPLTQSDLADLFGLSTVHVNRSLQDLRREGLLSLQDRRVSIHDVGSLREMSMFSPAHFAPRRGDVVPQP